MKRPKTKKAFYIILSLCLAAVGTASYLSSKITTARNTKDESTTQMSTQIISPSELFETQVNENVSGIPDERYTDEAQPSETVTQDPVKRNKTFSLPLNSGVLKAYSNTDLVKSETMGDWRVHNGTDFAGSDNEQVMAINNGIIKKVYDDALWGTVVEINHGGTMTARYCGLKAETAVSEGDYVSSGDVIGVLGVIPIEESDGIHLHLEIYDGEKAVDPVSAMNKSPEELNG